MTISFDQIPANFRAPHTFIEINNEGALKAPVGQPYQAIVLAQKIAAGSQAELSIFKATNADQVRNLAGAGSIAHLMAQAWFAQTTIANVDFVLIDDLGAGVAAAGALQISGPATKAGTLNLLVGGISVKVAVALGDTGGDIATKIVAAITDNDDLPITAVVNGGEPTQADFIAKNKGELMNGFDIRLNYFIGEETPEGLTPTITPFTGGTGNPDVQEIIDILGTTPYNVFAHNFNDAANLTALETELANRFKPAKKQDASAFTASSLSFSGLTALGNTRNSPHNTIIENFGSPSPSFEKAAETAAIVTFFGEIDPARPFQTLPYKRIRPPLELDRFTLEERNLLLFDGIATSRTVGGVVQVDRLITTYQLNEEDGPDTSFLNVNTLLTISRLRFDITNVFAQKYPRHKLADDGTKFGEGQPVMTPSVAKAEFVSLFELWEGLGLVENATQFIKDLVVERNQTDQDRLDAILPPDLINQFRIAGFQIRFIV